MAPSGSGFSWIAMALLCTGVVLLQTPGTAQAQDASQVFGVVSDHDDVDGDGNKDAADLAQQLSNPVATLISVPIQNNIDFGNGPNDATSLTTNIQPVIPVRLNEDWNLISRTILPVRYRGALVDSGSSDFGLGDTVQSLFLSPEKPVEGWILGAGPVILLPTATDSSFQSRQLGLGPTAVALQQKGGFTYGGLVNHVWGVNNPDSREQVNATFLQPFVSYTFPTATTLSLNSESTFDWSASEWTVPITASVNQLTRIGDQAVQFQLGGRFFPTTPTGDPDWGIRFSVTFLFPEKKWGNA